MTMSMLEQLQAQLATLPAGWTKHEMEPGFEAMAQWIETLENDHRAKVLSELPAWLEGAHPWHSRAALEIALRLRDHQLLEAAVRQARKRGVYDLAEGEEYPPWLTLHLDLLSTISRWQGDPGPEARAYIKELRGGVSATSYSRRLLGIRAWFTQCLLEPAGRQKACLGEGLAALRTWRDPRLLRSGLSLLHAYFKTSAEGVADLKELLTLEEFGMAFPELAAS
jgi:hypothetical protein